MSCTRLTRSTGDRLPTFQPRSRPWETAGYQSSRHRDLLSSPGHLHPGQGFQGFQGFYGFLQRKKKHGSWCDRASLWHYGQWLVAGHLHFASNWKLPVLSCFLFGAMSFFWRRRRRKTCLGWEVCWCLIFSQEHSRERGHMAAAEELWRRADSGTAKAIASPRALQSIAGLSMNLCHGFAAKRHRFCWLLWP